LRHSPGAEPELVDKLPHGYRAADADELELPEGAAEEWTGASAEESSHQDIADLKRSVTRLAEGMSAMQAVLQASVLGGERETRVASERPGSAPWRTHLASSGGPKKGLDLLSGLYKQKSEEERAYVEDEGDAGEGAAGEGDEDGWSESGRRPTGPRDGLGDLMATALGPRPRVPGGRPTADGSRTTRVAEAKAAASFSTAEGSYATLVRTQRETARILEGLSRKKNRYEEEEDSDGDDEKMLGGGSRKFGLPQKLTELLQRHPEKVINDWERHIKETLDWEPGNQWSFKLYSKDIRRTFGQHSGMYRVHYHLSNILDIGLIHQRPLEAFARLVQLCEATHQASLDNGRWVNAQGLLGAHDPLATPTFSGLENEMQALYSHQKALQELKSAGRLGGPFPPRKTETEEGHGGPMAEVEPEEGKKQGTAQWRPRGKKS
jgi:hypothetical protein